MIQWKQPILRAPSLNYVGNGVRLSAEMAAHMGAFAGFESNKDSALRVLRNHRRAAYNASPKDYELFLNTTPVGIDPEHCPEYLLSAARSEWDRVLDLSEQHGIRNAQVTVIAPTGTIGLVMDCDTTGVEPDFALVKFKKLAGGGYFKIINQSVPFALRTWDIQKTKLRISLTTARVEQLSKGVLTLTPSDSRTMVSIRRALKKIEGLLAGAFDLSMVFNPDSTFGDEFILNKLGVPSTTLNPTRIRFVVCYRVDS